MAPWAAWRRCRSKRTIGSGDVAGLPGHYVRKLCTFPWLICATPGYVENHGAPSTPAELGKHALIGFRDRATGTLDAWRFKDPASGNAVRHQPHPRHTFDDPEGAWAMICAGL